MSFSEEIKKKALLAIDEVMQEFAEELGRQIRRQERLGLVGESSAKSPPQSMIYAIGRSKYPIPGEPIKIGTSQNVPARLREFQTSSPEELFLIGTIEGDKEAEKRIHTRLRTYHIRGEWFRASYEWLHIFNPPEPEPEPEQTISDWRPDNRTLEQRIEDAELSVRLRR